MANTSFYGGAFFESEFYAEIQIGTFFYGDFFDGDFFIEYPKPSGGGGGNPYAITATHHYKQKYSQQHRTQEHHQGRSSGNNFQGTWNGIPLIDILAAQEAPKVVENKKQAVIAPKTLSERIIRKTDREVFLSNKNELVAKIKASILVSETLKRELQAKREADALLQAQLFRKQRDEQDIMEFMSIFGTILMRKGRHGKFMGKATKHWLT